MWMVHVVLCLRPDLLGMSVVRGMKGVGGRWEMCMRLARGGLTDDGGQ